MKCFAGKGPKTGRWHVYINIYLNIYSLCVSLSHLKFAQMKIVAVNWITQKTAADYRSENRTIKATAKRIKVERPKPASRFPLFLFLNPSIVAFFLKQITWAPSTPGRGKTSGKKWRKTTGMELKEFPDYTIPGNPVKIFIYNAYLKYSYD